MKESKFAVKYSDVKGISATFLKESITFTQKGAKVNSATDTISKVIEKITEKKNSKNEVLFYIVQYKKDKNRTDIKSGGYTIVSGDKRIEPVLAFSESDDYNENNSGLLIMLEDYINLIEYAKKAFNEPIPKIKALWDTYEKASGGKILSCPYYDPECCPPNSYFVNGPLLNTNWSQGTPFNALCPPRSCGEGGNSDAGCGAIAVSMVLNYYTRPEIKSQFGLTNQPNKPVLNPQLSFPFDNTSNGGPSWSQTRAKLINWTGEAANSNYYFWGNFWGSTCSTLTWRENIKDPFQAAGYNNIGNRGGYLSNLQSIQNEVAAGRPVIMDGTTAAMAFGSWHIWVIDGIQTSEYWTKDYSGTCNLAAYLFFHHNWGQGGAGTWCGDSNIVDEGQDVYDTYLNTSFGMRP